MRLLPPPNEISVNWHEPTIRDTEFVCAADFAIGDQLIYDCEEHD